MKRFIAVMLAVAAAAIAVWYLIFVAGVYLPRRGQQSLTVPFKTEDRQLLRLNEAGEYEPFSMRCVEVSASMPGYFSTQFMPTAKDYGRWLQAIGEMGANTVKVRTVMDSDFYRALDDYNRSAAQPLYLLQAIPVNDAANYGPETAFDDGFLGDLIRDGRDLVDIIHGRKMIPLSMQGNGSGSYDRDISRWVLGFVVGDTWSADTMEYTNHSLLHTELYAGRYFSVTGEATAFESMLAQVMDEVAAYETDKYGAQRPIGFSNSPDTDFLEYDENYALQLKKYAQLDAEHVRPSAENLAGTFAAYRLYDFCDDFSAYLSAAQKRELRILLRQIDTSTAYDGYLDLMARYHTMPVLCSGYGFSTARGVTRMDRAPLTEREQGEALTAIYRDAMDCGWVGVSIATWQDEWESKTWNTSSGVNMQRRNFWHDLQTEGQNYGLMAFEPVDSCVVDGDASEWSQKNVVQTTDTGLTLSARRDWEGLYLLLQGPGVDAGTTRYIALDTGSETGSFACQDPDLEFDRAVDFVLVLDGTDNTRLLVQERYSTSRWNYRFELTGRNAFSGIPDRDTSKFGVIQMVTRNPALVEEYALLSAAERWELTALGTWDTGDLVHGSADPASPDYTSLADFCFGNGCVEIRIPWLLLNVADPSVMSVHRDYYDNYGAEFRRASRFWMGVAQDGSVNLAAFDLRGTGQHPSSTERLKDSYEVVRSEWRKAAAL